MSSRRTCWPCRKRRGLGFERLIVSATTPCSARLHLLELRVQTPVVVRRCCPDYEAEYARRGWSLPRIVDRVYVNERARVKLGWQPRDDFTHLIQRLRTNEDYRSDLARAVGTKLYHSQTFADGPYPVS